MSPIEMVLGRDSRDMNAAMDSIHDAMPGIWLLRVILLGAPALVSKGAIWQVDLEHAGSLGERNSISPEAQGHIVLNMSWHCRANMPVHGRPSCQLPFLLVQDLLLHKHVGQAGWPCRTWAIPGREQGTSCAGPWRHS